MHEFSIARARRHNRRFSETSCQRWTQRRKVISDNRKQKRPREAASLFGLLCELPSRVAIFIDGNRLARRCAQLHAVLDTPEVVTHVPVIRLR